MTDALAPTDAALDATADGPFARLIAELAELGYEPDDSPDLVTYTATDGDTAVLMYLSTEPPQAVLTGTNSDDTDWQVAVTAATPPTTQLLILYAALNTTNARVAVTAAATALGLTAY